MGNKLGANYLIGLQIDFKAAGGLENRAEAMGLSVSRAHINSSVLRGISNYLQGQSDLELLELKDHGVRAEVYVGVMVPGEETESRIRQELNRQLRGKRVTYFLRSMK